jgi:hypothetical protein
MNNRWLPNIVLLVLVAALAALALLRPGRAPETRPLTNLTAEQVTTVRIERPDQGAVALVRQGTDWRLTAPLAARANSHNVTALTAMVEMPAQPLAPGGAAAEYGLDKSRAVLHFDDVAVALGSMHPLDNRVYARRDTDVVLLPAQAYGAAMRPWTDYLDTRLLDASRRPVGLRLPDFTVELRRGTWERQPAIAALSGDRINDFVSEWRSASAISVAPYSKRPPLATIELRFDDDSRLSLAVLARQPDFVVYRKDEGLEYRFPADVGRRLLTLAPE